MRSEATSTGDSAAGVVFLAPWRITKAEVLPGFRLTVKFTDGTEGEVDLSELLVSDDAGVFASLRNPSIFAQVYIEHGAVTWPGEIDLAPDAMYDEIRQTGKCILK